MKNSGIEPGPPHLKPTIIHPRYGTALQAHDLVNTHLAITLFLHLHSWYATFADAMNFQTKMRMEWQVPIRIPPSFAIISTIQ
jgi:hypothetical protein